MDKISRISDACKGIGEQQRIGKWCPGTDSNRRHADFQSAALPTELPGQIAGVAATMEGAYKQAWAPLSSPILFFLVAAFGDFVCFPQPVKEIAVPATLRTEGQVGNRRGFAAQGAERGFVIVFGRHDLPIAHISGLRPVSLRRPAAGRPDRACVPLPAPL